METKKKKLLYDIAIVVGLVIYVCLTTLIFINHKKIAQLKSIGFEWDSRDAKWMQRLDELYKYKEDHGDCLVPSKYPDNPSLSNWVQSQRANYKLYKKGGKTNLTERRLKILMDAGFSFSGVIDTRQQETKEEASQQEFG